MLQKKLASWSYMLFANSGQTLDNILTGLEIPFLNTGTTFATFELSGN